ncbi:MAG: low molecular weight protein arginine phosphatase [Clostridia bacterium]|nr:low molecular weight protein arginine phosphatase [Clostridia bacterium]
MRNAADYAEPLTKKGGNGEDSARRVLFVCTGNTCRSPMAAALLNHLSVRHKGSSAYTEDSNGQPRYIATSAGLYAAEGDPITPLAANALCEAGVVDTPSNPYKTHRAHRVSEADVAAADVIVAITASHAMELMLRFPDAASRICTLPMDIADPFGGSAEDYRTCLAQLRFCLQSAFLSQEETP